MGSVFDTDVDGDGTKLPQVPKDTRGDGEATRLSDLREETVPRASRAAADQRSLGG